MSVLRLPVYLAISCIFTAVIVAAQSRQPYPNAVTDRSVRHETPKDAPPVNRRFTD
jgi:hypothetical protein